MDILEMDIGTRMAYKQVMEGIDFFIHCQKDDGYWSHSEPGDLIDGYFGDMDIGTRMAYKQVIEGIDFFIHCQKDDGYVNKITSTHGTVNEVQGHVTFWMVR